MYCGLSVQILFGANVYKSKIVSACVVLC